MKLASFIVILAILSSLFRFWTIEPYSANSVEAEAVEEDGRVIGEAEAFEALYTGSFREEKKPYGYIDCDYVIKKHRANDVSSIYLVEANISFTPGKIAQDLGDTDYGDWYNSSGYIKIKAMRASNEVGYSQVRYGGTPVFKDAYPNSSYTYSNSYQIQRFALSAKKAPDANEYTLVYTYFYPQKETNRLQVSYMFEMNNSGHNLREGDLALRIEYQMTVGNNGWWLLNKANTFSGYAYYNYY